MRTHEGTEQAVVVPRGTHWTIAARLIVTTGPDGPGTRARVVDPQIKVLEDVDLSGEATPGMLTAIYHVRRRAAAHPGRVRAGGLARMSDDYRVIAGEGVQIYHVRHSAGRESATQVNVVTAAGRVLWTLRHPRPVEGARKSWDDGVARLPARPRHLTHQGMLR